MGERFIPGLYEAPNKGGGQGGIDPSRQGLYSSVMEGIFQQEMAAEELRREEITRQYNESKAQMASQKTPLEISVNQG